MIIEIITAKLKAGELALIFMSIKYILIAFRIVTGKKNSQLKLQRL